MARPPIPTELKRRRGTLRPSRLPGGGGPLPPVDPIDAAVLYLTPDEALVRALAVAPWVLDVDAPKVSLLRQTLTLLDGGSLRDRIEAGKLASRLLDELGLSPTSRARLGLAEVKTASTLETLRSNQRKETE